MIGVRRRERRDTIRRGSATAVSVLPGPLWREIEPLLPPEPPKPKGGRPRVPDRACLTGIIFALRTGLPRNMIPVGLGCGSGPTCRRRPRDWAEAGVWDAVHKKLLNALAACGRTCAAREARPQDRPCVAEHVCRAAAERLPQRPA